MIYFIQDDSSLAIKIGHTDGDPENRLRQLQTGSAGGFHLLATCPGTKADEADLHSRFGSYRMRGEWFTAGPALLQFIIGIPRKAAENPKNRWRDKHPQSSPLRIYLAGKVGKYISWRDKITGGDIGDEWGGGSCGGPDNWSEQWPEMEGLIFGHHTYTGPFYVACDHGCNHGKSKHGCGQLEELTHCGTACEDVEARSRVVSYCNKAIQRSDLVFAWIDTNDCYGTLAEIGYAAAAGKLVQVVFAQGFEYSHDLWFASYLSNVLGPNGCFSDPANALGETLDHIYERVIYNPPLQENPPATWPPKWMSRNGVTPDGDSSS